MPRLLIALLAAAAAAGASHADHRDREHTRTRPDVPRYGAGAPQPARAAPPARAPHGIPAIPVAPRGPTVIAPQILPRTDQLPFARDRVVVFVGPHCPQCEQAVQLAREAANRPVDVLDITSGGYAAEQYAALRVSGVPATVAGSWILLGVDYNGTRNVLSRAGMRENNPDQP